MVKATIVSTITTNPVGPRISRLRRCRGGCDGDGALPAPGGCVGGAGVLTAPSSDRFNGR
jgi:hypothetical protein